MKVPYEVARRIFGSDIGDGDTDHAAFFTLWAMLEVELEEALAEERRESAASKEPAAR